MSIGDIVCVPDIPVPENDVLAYFGTAADEYPVYAVVHGRDAYLGILTEVYTSRGLLLSEEWWFKCEEAVVLETPAKIDMAENEVYALGA